MSEPLRILSLWQPWASLIAFGEKSIETRSWQTKYRGWVAIHAAKRWTAAERNQLREPFFREAMEHHFAHLSHAEVLMPLGAIVAVARLTACYPMLEIADRYPDTGRDILVGPDSRLTVDDTEHAFGIYAPGRYAWVLRDTVAVPEPIPFRGRQGLIAAPEEIRARLLPFMEAANAGSE